MQTPIVQPDIELYATEYLREKLPLYGYPVAPATPTGVRVSTKYKGNAQEVVVRRDGGPRQNIVLEAQRLGVNVYVKSDIDRPVSDLSLTVAALLVACPDGDPVVQAVQLGGPVAIADPAATRRYMTFELTTRGIELDPALAANGLQPLDGTNDPWRWAPDASWWVGPAYELTWLTGDEVPVPDLPVGGERVQVYVVDAATYLEARDLSTSADIVNSADSSPLVKPSDGSGIAFLTQAQPGFTDVMDAPPNPELDVTTMLGDVTLVTAAPDPWQWSDAWGGWVGPAYELTWLTGDTITPADIDLNYRIIVIEDPAPDAPDDATYLTGWTTTSGLAAIVATADGSGVGYVLQHEAGFSHTEVPDDALDPATMFGDFTVGSAYEFPDLASGSVLYPWPE